MVKNFPVWAALFAILYAIGAILTFRHLFRVGRAAWRRRLLQVGASIVWPVYWIMVPGRGARSRHFEARTRALANAVATIFSSAGLRAIAFVGGVLAILLCAIGAIVALAIGVLTPARHLAALRDYWLGPQSTGEQDVEQDIKEIPASGKAGSAESQTPPFSFAPTQPAQRSFADC